MSARVLSHEDYTVGWICALPLEVAAAKAMLDEPHPKLPQPLSDPNTYTLGKIYGHNVVIFCLPYGIYGTISAASVISHMISTFPSIRFGLMVGIGGGVPSNGVDIRLGDIVVSKPTGNYSGVVQYDYGKTVTGGKFEQTGTLNQPPPALLTCLSELQADRLVGKTSSISTILSEMFERRSDLKIGFAHPGQEQDQLFQAEYDHVESEDTCIHCDKLQLVYRERRTSDEPQIHYGLIASGNQVMKDGRTRDRFAHQFGILCFEMEAAGLMNQLPCLVIRGICDYSDSHKNEKWQGYAALTAAAFGRLLLSVVPVAFLKAKSECTVEMTAEGKACLQCLFLTDPAEDKNALKRRKGNRASGTCEWILETDELKRWLGEQEAKTENTSNILWLYGNPGTGKSTTAITIAEELPKQCSFQSGSKTLAYFFCDSSSENQRTVTAILRGLLYQLVKQRSELMRFLLPKYGERKENIFTSFDALWSMLIDIGSDIATGEKYCVIDALDECEQKSQGILLAQISQSFQRQNLKHSQLGIHVLITSRPYLEIGRELNQFTHKDLASYQNIKKDLQVLVEEKVKELSRKNRYTASIEIQVARILQEKAEGTFLWVGIACDELVHVRSRDAVKALQKLPRGLHSLYQNLLDTALEQDEDDNQTIMQILSVVAISRRPLSVAELSDACQLYYDEDEEHRLAFTREDIEMCRLIVTVQDGLVQLLHKSVKDFLLGGENRHQISELKAHAVLANQCISYLLNSFRPHSAKMQKLSHSFFEYAVLFWTEHASLGRSEFDIIGEHANFFLISSNEREKWLRIYRSKKIFNSRISEKFSIFHVAARWGIPCLVNFALADMQRNICPTDVQATSEDGTRFDDAKFKAFNDVTPLEEAAVAGQIDVMTILLERGIPGMIISERVLRAAARNNSMGREVMELLLGRRGDQTQITKDVVKTAANDGRKEVTELLLDRRGDQIQITEDVVKAAARNGFHGKEVMELLLDRRGDEIQITEDVVKAAAGNIFRGKEVTELLLDRRGDQIQITEDVVKAAAKNRSNGKEVMKLLLDRRGYEIQITEDVIKAAVENGTNQLMKLLLDRRGDEIQITEDVIKAAARNIFRGREVMELLLDRRGDQIQITEDVVKAAAKNEPKGKEVMELLLDRRGYEIQITEDVVKAAAGNIFRGREVMELLLDRRGDEIQITEDVAKAAAGNIFRGKEVTELLLDRRGDQIQITEDVVKAAAKNRSNGKEVMELLLDRRGDHIQITEDVVKAATRKGLWGNEVMPLLLDRGIDARSKDKHGRTPVSYAAEEGNLAVVALLVDRHSVEPDSPDKYGRTPLSYAASSGCDAMVALLLDRYGATADSKDMNGRTPLLYGAWYGHEAVVRLLLAKNSVNPCSKTVSGRTPLSLAARGGYSGVVDHLLEKIKAADITFTCDGKLIVTACSANDHKAQITYDGCQSRIPNFDSRHNCKICNNGIFNVCQDCLANGLSCLQPSHKLVKRMVKGGNLTEVPD